MWRLLLVLFGVLLALFFGVYLMFIGGIVQVVDAVKTENVDSLQIAFGVARIVFAAPVGWICFMIPTAIASTE